MMALVWNVHGISNREHKSANLKNQRQRRNKRHINAKKLDQFYYVHIVEYIQYCAPEICKQHICTCAVQSLIYNEIKCTKWHRQSKKKKKRQLEFHIQIN